MKKIILLRHCDTISRESYAKNGVFDYAHDMSRPLSKLGKIQAKKLGKVLGKDYKVDYIFCSIAKRTKQSAKSVIKHFKKSRIVLSDLIIPDVGLDGYFKLLDSKEFKNATYPLIIGHEPDISNFVKYISGANIELKKGAFVGVIYDNDKFDNGVYVKEKDGYMTNLVQPEVEKSGKKENKISKVSKDSKDSKLSKDSKDSKIESKAKSSKASKSVKTPKVAKESKESKISKDAKAKKSIKK